MLAIQQILVDAQALFVVLTGSVTCVRAVVAVVTVVVDAVVVVVVDAVVVGAVAALD